MDANPLEIPVRWIEEVISLFGDNRRGHGQYRCRSLCRPRRANVFQSFRRRVKAPILWQALDPNALDLYAIGDVGLNGNEVSGSHIDVHVDKELQGS